MPDFTVVKYGLDTYGRRCLNCKTPCLRSRCDGCAANHRERMRLRLAAEPTSERGRRQRFGYELGRALRSDANPLPLIEARSDKVGDCWNWPGGRTVAGYGSYGAGGKIVLAHRFVYETANGPIPDGSVVHHACANRLCVRPDHLRAVTPAENAAEMFERKALLARIAHLELRLREVGIEP